ncbi:MAG: ABC-2 type transport system ATP-binding protein [Alteromonadaceae bacterium]|jgi:ABC-2 type transport system ATP-binding protein
MELNIQHLNKTYANGTQALNDLSMTIKPGMFGLLGPNGAGKSSLMRTISTLQNADSGSIHFGDINVLEDKHEVRKLIGYLPQDFDVYPNISADDLLNHFAVLKGISDKKQRRQVVDELLQLVNLDDMRHKAVASYSGGMKRRFGIAQALLGEPKLVIVDEPTAGLDPEEQVRFHNLLSEIGRNIVVILSTHIVTDVSDLCADMAIICKGQKRLAGHPLALIDKLKSKVWKKIIDNKQLADYQRDFELISHRLVLGSTAIHCFSDSAPDRSFELIEPNLEDVYFCAIKGLNKE